MAKKDDLLSNFIPISRELFEHPLWCEERDFSRFEAWLYLLKEARFEDTKLLDKGKMVVVKRGQVYVSYRFLANAFNWTVKRVRTFLDLIESDNMITRGTVKGTGQTVITICNYNTYNVSSGSKSTVKGTQWAHDGHTMGTKSNTDNTVNTDTKEKLSKESKKKEESLEDKKAEQRKKLDAAKAATLKRKKEFYSSLIPYIERYGKDMIRAFYDYWTEPNRSGSKMKFELQKTWDLALRLGTWNNRESIYGKTKETIQAGPTIVD